MKNLKIGTRLALGFGLVLMLMVLMTGIGLWRLQAVADATRTMMQQDLATERLVSDWYRLIHTSVRRTLAISKSADPSLGTFFAEETTSSNKEVAALQKKVAPLLDSAQEKALLADVMAMRERYVASRTSIAKLKQEGKLPEVEAELEQTFIPTSKSYLKTLENLLDMQRSGIDATGRQIETIYQDSCRLLLGLGMFVLIFGGACVFWLSRGITRPLGRAVLIARTVASNDLTSRFEVSSNDETGQLLQALQDMNDNLGKVVGTVRAGTDMIATASNQISSGNVDLSSRTEAQAGNLEETAASMEELTSTVKQNADNALQANNLAVVASEVAQRGGELVSQVVETMDSIDASSKRVVDIISVIDGIAFQTNILALNAAVEAARAGEQGRGFAVVATEVRSLAQRSASAAKDIKMLIGDSVNKVEAGNKLVEQAGATMKEVVTRVKRVTDIMGEISAASREQSAGIEQVNQAIAQMDRVTQQNAALVEEATAAAESLQDQAASLAGAVRVFKLGPPRSAVAHTETSSLRTGEIRYLT